MFKNVGSLFASCLGLLSFLIKYFLHELIPLKITKPLLDTVYKVHRSGPSLADGLAMRTATQSPHSWSSSRQQSAVPGETACTSQLSGDSSARTTQAMCTLEEIVELDMEIVDSKQFEEMFEKSISSKTPYTEESNMSSKTPYSDVTQVSAYILTHSAR